MTARWFAARVVVLATILTGCATTDGPVLPESNEVASKEVASIEGPPIELDSPDLDPRYKDYLTRVTQMIKEKWGYPCVKTKYWFVPWCDYKSVDLVIDFGILKDGRVPYVIVRRPSQFAVYNEYAVNAVTRAAPFPPIPERLVGDRKGLPIRATFKYIVVDYPHRLRH